MTDLQFASTELLTSIRFDPTSRFIRVSSNPGRRDVN